MMESSSDSLANRDSSLSQSAQRSLESLLLSDQEDDSLQSKTDNFTQFTHSTAWFVINSLSLNPRTCSGNFERGGFNLYDSVINKNSKFVHPYLPRDLRILIENIRVMEFSSEDKMPRCLHFPLQENELKVLLAILSNLNLNNNDNKIYKNKLVFLMRIAGRVMEGRVSFDASRILNDLIKNKFTIKDDDVGIFSVPEDHPVEFDKKMTIRSVPISKELGKTRAIALNKRIFAIASSKSISVIDTEKKKNIKFPVGNIQTVCSVPNGNFLTCSKDGFVHEIVMNNDVNGILMHPVTYINDSVGDFKISFGGERNYAISNNDRTKIYSGIQQEYYQINLDTPYIDFDINNDDIYVATENSVEYYQWGKHYASWTSPEQMASICVDDMANSIGCCTKSGIYMIDLRSPHINALCTQNCNNLVSLHVSPFLDLAVAITKNGIISFDMRQTESTLSQISFSSSRSPSISRSQSPSVQSPLTSPVSSSSSANEKMDIKGKWMPESRLFSLAFSDSFNITCPYLKSPILESYKIPCDNIVSLHSNLQISVVQQESFITFIGGYGYPFHVPSVL